MIRKPLIAVATALVLVLALAGSASAAFEVTGYEGDLTTPAGNPDLRAGAHPDLTTTITFKTKPGEVFGIPVEVTDGNVRDTLIDLPPGFVGNPGSTPKCTQEDLLGPGGFHAQCAPESQVGVAYITTYFVGGFTSRYPVFNLVPPPGVAGQFGFNVSGAVVLINTKVEKNGEYSIGANVEGISQGLALGDTTLTLWGVPASPEHDSLRDPQGEHEVGGEKSTAAELPFLGNPTSCPGTPLSFGLLADSWQNPGDFQAVSFDEGGGNPLTVEDCESVPFDPTFDLRATSGEADSPSGVEVEISMPQNQNPLGRREADLRNVELTLPAGMAINPSSATGLGSCSPAEIGIGGDGPAACPDDSKIGSVEIETPLLERPLSGGVFLAAPEQNPFGSLLAIYLSVADPVSGVRLKFAGKVAADPETGQLKTTFTDNPQLPFSELRLSLFGGSRASLVNPPGCGTHAAAVRLDPWSGSEPVSLPGSIEIGTGPRGTPCPSGAFDPKLAAGSVNPLAGKPTAFTLKVSREDGSAVLATIQAALPEGLLAKLAGIPYCPDQVLASISGDKGAAAAENATPACPAASAVGRSTVAAGAGQFPFQLESGRVYLAGPYRGADLSLAIVTPVLAGPFDLGSVVVRTALRVDPITTRVTAISDPLPRILHGIPLGLRSVRIDLDREDFTVNPTSCREMSVEGSMTAFGGAQAALSNRFQVAGCSDLGFKPKLSLKLSGPTRRTGHPALRAVLTMPKGGANIGKAVVTLPETEFLENAHIRTICTRVQYAAEQCPKASVYGYAKAWTPLLDKPLQGPVYLRSSNHKLPDLAADLNGQIDIDLAGRIDSPKGKIRNTFWAVPDAPVSKFVLTMQGGKKGLLVNNIELCRAKPRAKAQFTGQNGRTRALQPLVQTDCGKK